VIPNVPAATEPDPPEEVVAQEEQELANLQGRTDIGEIERGQLVKARRGQGIFRTNVRMNERRCRVTGITDPAHLRASHIKPWKDCTDAEKLHGCIGLLLAPHVDHLFDRGWISFTDDGDLLVGRGLSLALLQAWGIPAELNVRPFSELQAKFLDYHRTQVFRT
jgi:predicted restriction endonuclease